MEYVISAVLTTLFLAVLVLLIAKMVKTKRMLCVTCRAVSNVRPKPQGSAAVELLLYFLFILPGVIYTFWRASNQSCTCPQCGSREMIPTNTLRAIELQHHT